MVDSTLMSATKDGSEDEVVVRSRSLKFDVQDASGGYETCICIGSYRIYFEPDTGISISLPSILCIKYGFGGISHLRRYRIHFSLFKYDTCICLRKCRFSSSAEIVIAATPHLEPNTAAPNADNGTKEFGPSSRIGLATTQFPSNGFMDYQDHWDDQPATTV
ncbi:uncharacterized protein PGTG_04874 [Puccinia graminis f. sp. tritici CRL 75-36-700-3]|uniref:Uncharacterized protein n=1 Tax=Puccinia graminis f. sp. tritici (strain CRL 75-36-700-3 / race SCCL) TaxID=418459 RepID=E3K361_PUCGT|nr:uncharacterized protein PGTG_04874 [Puccinia graminis f. sp. tritici CRL 75-36-700-3]EFP78918.1 hypothetical protein PGTG_04874 [Puccinia graminis f. sp. tritici CRL 75-36-700-3]